MKQRRLLNYLHLSLIIATAFLHSNVRAQVSRGEPLPRRGSLGLQLGVATADEAKLINRQSAVKILGVLPNLTGSILGAKEGDLVDKLNGTPVSSVADVSKAMTGRFAGTDLKLEIYRNGSPVSLRGKIKERPKQKADGFEVVYDQVVSLGKRIRVIATHPTGPGPFPTVILIGGIGAYSVDGDFSSTVYGNVLDPLAKAGYATVRIDKPGQGDSEGPAYTELLFDVELDAYVQGIRLAKTFAFVNPNKIAIFGQSMGGCFGPLAALQEPVAGVAVSGTVAKTWVEYQLENTRRQSLLAGAKPAEVEEEIKALGAISNYLFYEGLSIAQIIEKHPELAEMTRGMSPDGKTYSGVGIPFFQQLAKKNLPEAWSKIDSKVIALYCENDFLSGQPDHEYIAQIVNGHKQGNGTFKLLPNTDHGFYQTSSPTDSMMKWGKPGSKFNPNIVTALKEWLDKVLLDKS